MEEIIIRDLSDLSFFASEISKKLKPGTFLLLNGDLGVGKTTLTQFICSKLNIKEKINSPTFSIVQRYWIEEKKCFLNHFDFFRLKKNEDLSFFEELKFFSINIIEWPEINNNFWMEEKNLIYLNIEFTSDGFRKIICKGFNVY
jgi:tRNA threonylcarbamoyladenosine biosynthesis protein TsaE